MSENIQIGNGNINNSKIITINDDKKGIKLSKKSIRVTIISTIISIGISIILLIIF
jgi:hypothetical protein